MSLQHTVTDALSKVSHENIGVLCRLAYYALTYGKTPRAIDYLKAAELLAPQNESVLRLQAVAYLDNKAPMHAITALRKLQSLRAEPSVQEGSMMALLQSMALHQMDNKTEAKTYFGKYLMLRQQHEEEAV